MSYKLEDSLVELEKMAPKLASEIADTEIICRIDGIKSKYDRHGREIVELTLYCKDYGTVISAYAPMYVKELVKSLKGLGINTVREMMQKCYKFAKISLPVPKQNYTKPYPRFIPVEVADCKLVQ